MWQGALYPIVNRVLREDETLGIPRPILTSTKEQVDRFEDLIDGVEPDNPATYTKVVRRLISEQIEDSHSWESLSEATKDMGVDLFNLPRGILSRVEMNGLEGAFKVDDAFVYSVCSGVYLASDLKTKQIYIDTDISGAREKAVEFLREECWQGYTSLQMAVTNPPEGGWSTDVEIMPFHLDETDYIGPLEGMINKAVRMQKTGERWCLLLQGKPGVGKTTFCMNVARKIGHRVLFVGKNAFGECGAVDWKQVLGILQPSVVLIEDPDYLDEGALERRLEPLTEGRTAPSLVLMTSNDMSAFPDAMKRPGRIDHIINVDPPGEDVLDRMLEQKAQEFGIEVCHHDKLRKIHLEYSPAHLREVFKRAAAWGWDDPLIWNLHKEEEE